jgi:hypothetical protein
MRRAADKKKDPTGTNVQGGSFFVVQQSESSNLSVFLLPGEVGKGSVRLSHLMRIFLLLDRISFFLGCENKFLR